MHRVGDGCSANTTHGQPPTKTQPGSKGPGGSKSRGSESPCSKAHLPGPQLLATTHWQRAFSIAGVCRSLTGRSGRGKKADAVTAAACSLPSSHVVTGSKDLPSKSWFGYRFNISRTKRRPSGCWRALRSKDFKNSWKRFFGSVPLAVAQPGHDSSCKPGQSDPNTCSPVAGLSGKHPPSAPSARAGDAEGQR